MKATALLLFAFLPLLLASCSSQSRQLPGLDSHADGIGSVQSATPAMLGAQQEIPVRQTDPSADLAAQSDEVLEAESTLYPQTIPCPMALPVGSIEGDTVVCRVLSVPANHEDPDGEQIELVYAILRTPHLSPARDPVLYLHGGPGSAELERLPALAERFAAFLQNRDVIVLDQRGAGYSSGPLDCATGLAANPDAVMAALTEAQGGNDGGLDYLMTATDRLCAEIVTSQGADLTVYDTVNNAADVHRLLQTLLENPGETYDTVNLYAWSYGTTLALETLRQSEAGIRSIILDGTAPPNIKTAELGAQARVEAAETLFADCESEPACDEAYPDLANRFNELTARLNAAPIELPTGDLVDGAALVNLITLRNKPGADPAVTANLPRIISELDQGETATYVAWLADELTPLDWPLAAEEPSTGDLPGLIDAGQKAAAQIASLNAQSDALTARLQYLLALADAPPSPAIQFDQAARSLAAERADPVYVAAYTGLPSQPATAQSITAFLQDQAVTNEHLLSVLAGALNEEDIIELFRLIAARNRNEGFGALAAGLVANRVFHCNDQYPFNTMDGEEAYRQNAPIPAMAAGVDSAAADLKACDLYAVFGDASDAFHSAVASDLPVLVLAGDNDIQTAPSWGETVREPLPNSYAVRFPAAGHGVIQHSQCAKDVAAAFFNNPQQQPVSACKADLVIPFVVDRDEAWAE